MPRYPQLNYEFGHRCPLEPVPVKENRSICDSSESRRGGALPSGAGRHIMGGKDGGVA